MRAFNMKSTKGRYLRKCTDIWTVVLIWSLVQDIDALFPTVCVNNATRSGVCCPIPEGFTEPCGWPVRGQCGQNPRTPNGDSRPEIGTLQDDRIHWPNHFFQYGCRCANNFYGFSCSECKYGYTGKDCLQKVKVVRKSALSYTADERKQFVHAVNLSKYTTSDFSALKVDNQYDAVESEELSFTPVTIYNLFVYRHYYAARASKQNPNKCLSLVEGVPVEFAHGGPSILPWHRLMLLTLERELQKLSGDPAFSIPYWDWTDIKGNDCPVCTADFFGETNYSDPKRHLKEGHPFSEWLTLCDPTKFNGCDKCDPSQPISRVRRNPGGNPLVPNMPGSDQLRYAMSLPDFDIYPYNMFKASTLNNRSFTKVVSGDVPWKQLPFMFHSQGHIWFNGTMAESVSTSPNDPIFLLHHGFVDKVYEGWLRKYKPTPEQFPGGDAPVGHAASDPIVPFYPPELNIDYFKESTEFGYDFDELDSIIMKYKSVFTAYSSRPTGDKKKMIKFIVVITGLAAAVVLVTVFVLWRKHSRTTHGVQNCEKDPLLPPNNKKTPYETLSHSKI